MKKNDYPSTSDYEHSRQTLIETIEIVKDTYNNIYQRLNNSNKLIEFEMDEDATIEDYYEELLNYFKIGVLARTKYKGIYVYNNEYNIRKKLIDIENNIEPKTINVNVDRIIYKFIENMGYMENKNVLGCFFYGSFLTGYNNKNSDIDLHIVFDNEDSKHLIRGNKYVDDIKIEYFEKPIEDIYLSIDNDFNNQNNALLSIIGTSKIIFDKTGDLRKLQQYALDKFSNPLPPLDDEDAREYVSIINNRMEKLEKTCIGNNPYFYHLYHLTIEKIRKFYHRLNGMPEVQTSKVFRVYTDENYRKSFYKDNIPEQEFIDMYLDAICDNSLNKERKLKKVKDLFDYSKRNVSLGNEYRILIKSRNGNYRK